MTTVEHINEPENAQPQKISGHEIHGFVVAFVAAVYSGFVCEQGWPGSAIALAPALIFGFLVFQQNLNGWSRTALVVAGLNVILLSAIIFEPSLLNLAMAWLTLSVFAYLHHNQGLNNYAVIGKALSASLIRAPINAVRDTQKINALRTQIGPDGKVLTLTNIILPIAAILVFGTLLVIANPLIEQAVNQLSWLDPTVHLFTWMPFVSLMSFIVLFAVFKLKAADNQSVDSGSERLWAASYFKPKSVIFTLLILNAMFASENILDLQYLWSNVTLPAGMNFAEYVHRSSYTLIITAILAGALMIFALQPGSDGETPKPLRGLIYLWTLQNLCLVASSARRTLDYVDAYGMTLWRLSGLIWMCLVAAGLTLIVLRVILKRSSVWLVNSNLIVSYVTLLICCLINLSSLTANWNAARAVQHLSATAAYQTLDIDLSYLEGLGSSALPATENLLAFACAQKNILIDYKPATPEIAAAEIRMIFDLQTTQSNWQTWTVHGAMLEGQ